MTLLYSSRDWDEVIFRDELLALDDRRDGFDLTLTLTRDTPRRDKDFGRRIDGAMIAGVLSTAARAAGAGLRLRRQRVRHGSGGCADRGGGCGGTDTNGAVWGVNERASSQGLSAASAIMRCYR